MHTFHRNKSRHLRLTIVGALGFAWAFEEGISQFHGVKEWANGKFMLFLALCSIFGWLLYFSGRQLFKPGIALKVDETGIYDYVSFAEAGLIRWEKIEQVFIADLHGKEHLIIKYVAGFLPPPGNALFSETLEAATRQAHGNAISISQRNLTESLTEVLTIIYALQPAH
ncbi:MAG: STM3941 family protein [Bacteroidota bacterium]